MQTSEPTCTGGPGLDILTDLASAPLTHLHSGALRMHSALTLDFAHVYDTYWVGTESTPALNKVLHSVRKVPAIIQRRSPNSCLTIH